MDRHPFPFDSWLDKYAQPGGYDIPTTDEGYEPVTIRILTRLFAPEQWNRLDDAKKVRALALIENGVDDPTTIMRTVMGAPTTGDRRRGQILGRIDLAVARARAQREAETRNTDNLEGLFGSAGPFQPPTGRQPGDPRRRGQ